MSDHELDDEEREYLAAFVAVATPSEAATSAALERAQERVDAPGVAEPEATSDEATSRAPWLAVGTAAVAIAAAVVLFTTLDLGTRLSGAGGEQTPGEAVYAEHDSDGREGIAVPRIPPAVPRAPRPGGSEGAELETDGELEPVEPEPEPEAAETETSEPEPSETETTTPRRSPRRPKVEPPTPEPETPSAPPAADATLHAELALLRPARKALRNGDHARALRLFDDHARSFPRSVLAPERNLGRIEALCGLGRRQDAKRAIDAFGREHPGSPLSKRVRDACPAQGEDAP